MANAERSDQFPVTAWQVLEKLKNGSENERCQSMDYLCQRYREPILCFLRWDSKNHEEAEDLVQGFLAYSIERKVFEKADPTRGRFRNLVLSALKNYKKNVRRAGLTKSRYPVGGFEEMDALEPDAAAKLWVETSTPVDHFNKKWRATLMGRAETVLKKEYAGPSRRDHYEILRRLLIAPMTEGATAPTQRDLANELGFTEKEVANRLITARRAYQRLLRAEVAATVGSEEEVEDEIRELFQHSA